MLAAGPLLLDACSASSKRSSPEAVHPSSNGLTQLHSLFAYPLESNFSGVRYNAAHVRRVQEHGLRVRHASSSQSSPADPVSADEGCRDGCEERWSVLLDAAKACCSAPPDLSKYPADFVVSLPRFPRKQIAAEHLTRVVLDSVNCAEG